MLCAFTGGEFCFPSLSGRCLLKIAGVNARRMPQLSARRIKEGLSEPCAD